MDLEYFSNSSKKSTELYGMDVLQDQKVNISNFIKQNEGDWEIILQNLAISQEESSFELLEFALIEMNTKNFNLLYKTFRKENFLEIMAQCVNLENCALLLEAFETLYESSSIIQPSIIQIIDQKLIFLRDQGTINDKLYVNFYDNYMKTKEMRHPSYILILETYQRKIAKTFHYIVHPFYDSLKTKNLLFEAILVWMLMLTHHQDQREYKYVVDIAKLIKSMFVKKAWFNSDIDFECFNRVMMVGFSAINQEFRDGELIRPDLNFCVILEMIEPELFRTMVSKLIERFCVNLETEIDIRNIFGNLIEASYSSNILSFLEILTQYYIKNQNYESLFFIFKHIILEKMLNKLTSAKYFDRTLDILKIYLYGFSTFYLLSYENSNILLKNYKIIVRHHRQNLQKFYEFFLCLFYLYKERRISVDNPDIFESLRRIKETNGLDMLTKEIYSNYRANTFEIPNKMLGVVVNLFESHNLAVPKTVKNFKGLQNLGNTCYMNSLLQCLFLTKTFRKELLNLRYSMKEIDQNQLIGEFFRLFSNLSELDLSNEKYLVPVEMKNSLPEPFCSSYQQQDSCEFSRLILEEIENQLNKIYKDKNLIKSLFYGKMKNTIKCMDCGKSVSRNEDLMDIPLGFSEEAIIESQIPRYDLLKMILAFFATEEFSQDNSYFCDKCKKKSTIAIKDTLIIKLPPILILSINRFKYDKIEGIKKKLFKYVKPYFSFNLKRDIFPELPINDTNSKDLDYDLYGIIIHSGFSSETGHYFSIAKDSDDLWYLFNDTIVKYLGKTVNLDEILLDHETPYMFFFANRSEKPLNLNYTERKSFKSSINSKIMLSSSISSFG